MNKLKKRKLQLLALCSGFTALTLGVLFATGKGIGSFVKGVASRNSQNYSITLDSGNKVTSAGDKVQKTALGNDVTFTYSGVQSSTSGHATLNSGGTIVNKDQITSIESITATYSGSGSLKARLAYVNDSGKWGDYFTLVSGSKVETGSNPYYLELKADGGTVNLTSAVFTFSCTTNPDAEPKDTSGQYEITFATNSSDSSSNIGSSSSSIMEQVASGSSYISSFSDGDRIYAGKSGLKFGASGGPGNVTINFNSTNVAYDISTVDISTAQYSSDSGKFNVYVNGASSYTQITPSAGGSVSVGGTLTSLTIETTTKRAYLCGLTLNYGSTVEPGAPENPTAYEVGFSASDANRNSYTTNSIFANDNALAVYSIKSDSTQSTLNPDEYSYEIRNAYNQLIDPTAKFPAEGFYTLTVSYGNYIPQEITLEVGEYVYITDVSASMSKVAFTTADILSNDLEGKLTATLEYSNNTYSNSIAYSEFASKGLGIKLLNPKGISYTITNPFGTAGTWTLKVYDLVDENMY